MAEYADREKQFDASLGNVMGGWMLDVAKADLARQQGWLEAVQLLTQPDKSGKIPQITLASGITGADGKPLSGADITFPVALALMGQQFAGTEADLGHDHERLGVDAGRDEGAAVRNGRPAKGSSVSPDWIGDGKGLGIVFSESEDRKRASDFRAATTASVKMARVPTPEPVQRVP